MRSRVVLITGAASGIGRAATTRFLADGWAVVAADVNAASGAALVDDHPARGDGGQLAFVTTDVAREQDVATAVQTATDQFGALDAVVNNAGVGGAFGPITELETEDWDYTFDVVTRGVFYGIKHGARAMRDAGTEGSIVNTGSIAGLSGGGGPQAYSAAKAAVINLTRSAAIELAPWRIRVNTVCPGLILTPILGPAAARLDAVVGRAQPWPEVGRPEDVAAVIRFLVSDDARFVTGEAINVDGGLTAAGPNLGDTLGGNPGLRGLVGVARGTTGVAPTVRRRLGGTRPAADAAIDRDGG